ncbi:flagellar hook-associated protein FlgK [Paracoccus simplex]|uniref:Flagellar hook-associated protein 1 n=1 Tax=Paracoccus simplex TaxID=2086346 RepID=A0ABV7S056_9RHOB
MSISSAISNAISGLTAVSRGTEVVSSNIANALTPGYARRELDLSPRLAERGGGVGLDGVSRAINAGLLADNRLAEADVGASTTLSTFHAAIERIFGTGTEASSLGQVLTAFDSALVSAASRPENEVRLGNVLGSATDLADKLNQISRAIQTERSSAEEAIRKDVSRLDAALGQVATLNKQIVSLAAQGKDVSALVDTRQAAIDGIAEIVPVKEVPRENGRIALFTSGGAILLDGSDPAWITFDSVPGLTPEMTVGNGALTRLSFNGKPLTEGQMTMFGGGTIGANFAIRDELAPACQRQIDAFARDLYDRLSATNVDPSLNAGGPGLFTDAQAAFDAAQETGFAGRIAVTTRVDPAAGGDLWRIRAGINAAGPGNAGDSAVLGNLSAALAASRSPASTALSQTPRSLQTLSAELSSNAATKRVQAEATALQDSTHRVSLQTALLADGVDTDKEMEGLLALERAYSANAKVFQTANDMLDAILRLT